MRDIQGEFQSGISVNSLYLQGVEAYQWLKSPKYSEFSGRTRYIPDTFDRDLRTNTWGIDTSGIGNHPARKLNVKNSRDVR
jgi:hypothetical protein